MNQPESAGCFWLVVVSFFKKKKTPKGSAEWTFCQVALYRECVAVHQSKASASVAQIQDQTSPTKEYFSLHFAATNLIFILHTLMSRGLMWLTRSCFPVNCAAAALPTRCWLCPGLHVTACVVPSGPVWLTNIFLALEPNKIINLFLDECKRLPEVCTSTKACFYWSVIANRCWYRFSPAAVCDYEWV